MTKILYIVFLSLVLSGCAVPHQKCNLSKKELNTLEVNIRTYTKQKHDEVCADIIVGHAWSNKYFSQGCVVSVSYPHDNPLCDPILDGEYNVLFDPKTLQPLDVLPWPDPAYEYKQAR